MGRETHARSESLKPETVPHSRRYHRAKRARNPCSTHEAVEASAARGGQLGGLPGGVCPKLAKVSRRVRPRKRASTRAEAFRLCQPDSKRARKLASQDHHKTSTSSGLCHFILACQENPCFFSRCSVPLRIYNLRLLSRNSLVYLIVRRSHCRAVGPRRLSKLAKYSISYPKKYRRKYESQFAG